MKTLKEKFELISNRHPAWSTLVCFNQLLKENIYTKDTAIMWFRRLVDKDDYEGVSWPELKSDLLRRIEETKSTLLLGGK